MSFKKETQSASTYFKEEPTYFKEEDENMEHIKNVLTCVKEMEKMELSQTEIKINGIKSVSPIIYIYDCLVHLFYVSIFLSQPAGKEWFNLLNSELQEILRLRHQEQMKLNHQASYEHKDNSTKTFYQYILKNMNGKSGKNHKLVEDFIFYHLFKAGKDDDYLWNINIKCSNCDEIIIQKKLNFLLFKENQTLISIEEKKRCYYCSSSLITPVITYIPPLFFIKNVSIDKNVDLNAIFKIGKENCRFVGFLYKHRDEFYLQYYYFQKWWLYEPYNGNITLCSNKIVDLPIKQAVSIDRSKLFEDQSKWNRKHIIFLIGKPLEINIINIIKDEYMETEKTDPKTDHRKHDSISRLRQRKKKINYNEEITEEEPDHESDSESSNIESSDEDWVLSENEK